MHRSVSGPRRDALDLFRGSLTLAKENFALALAMLDLHAKRQRMEELQQGKRENTGRFFRRLFGREED